MFAALSTIAFLLFLFFVTITSYKLGQVKTDRPKLCAVIGFLLAFFPPLALVYLVVLKLKEDTSLV